MMLSIVIPIYNAEKYLIECVKSILDDLDDKKSVEILLIDDGSKDNSLEICKEFQKNNACIRVFHHENHGVSYSRNFGVKAAAGDYIVFVDSDDVLMPGWSNTILSNISDGEDVIYFGGKCSIPIPSPKAIIGGIFGKPTQENVGAVATPWSKVFKRQFLISNHIFFDEEIINGEDGIFNLEVISKTERYRFVQASFYKYRVYPESSTKRYNSRFFSSNLKFLKEAEKILSGMKNISDSEREAWLGHSFYSSIYLLLFLISTIKDTQERRKKLDLLYDVEIRQLFARFKGYRDGVILNLFSVLVQNGHADCALYGVQVINFLRKFKKHQIHMEII